MVKLNSFLLMFLLWHAPIVFANGASLGGQLQPPKIETTYDRIKDKTTVRLAPVKIPGAKDKYHSLHMSPAFSYPGHEPRTPEIVDFELQTVVKGKLAVDLYVLFIVDGEKIFLSSNRWGVKKEKLGRGWMGEHLVFHMPYETFQKILKAASFELSLDGISFPVGEEQIESLRELAKEITTVPRNDSCTCRHSTFPKLCSREIHISPQECLRSRTSRRLRSYRRRFGAAEVAFSSGYEAHSLVGQKSQLAR